MTNNKLVMNEHGKVVDMSQDLWDALPAYRDKCLQEGLDTSPIDREVTKKHITAAYQEQGLTPPQHFFFVESPFAASLVLAILRYTDDENYSADGKTIDELLAAYQAIPEAKRTSLEIPIMRGQHDLSWLGYYGFLVEKMGLQSNVDIAPHLEVARNCGWWMPFEDTVIVSNRPLHVRRDPETNLHFDQGPAIEFRDGWKLYFWHGVSIPGNWIEDKANIPAAEVFRITNVEQRRCLAEILTWDRVIEELDYKVIDVDADPQIGSLLEVALPAPDGTISKERFLRVVCGTGRSFTLPVERNVSTALEANASTYDISVEDLLKLEVRT